MRANRQSVLVLLAGVAIGAATVHGLHAQSKPIAYVVAEIEVTNLEAFEKEWAPLGLKALKESGLKRVAVSGKTVSIEGAPPKSHIRINSFENLDKAIAAFNSPAYKEARKIGDKYATFRIFAFEDAQ